MNPYGWITISCDEPTKDQWKREAEAQKRDKDKALALAEEAVRDGERWCAPCALRDAIKPCEHFSDIRARLAALTDR